jgi:hypothetical protein
MQSTGTEKTVLPTQILKNLFNTFLLLFYFSLKIIVPINRKLYQIENKKNPKFDSPY